MVSSENWEDGEGVEETLWKEEANIPTVGSANGREVRGG